MKKTIILLLSFLAVINISCEKNTIGDFEEIENSFSTDKVLNKKGVAFTNNALAWSHKTSDMKAHWMYSWGNILREEIPENVEFVPMFWGAGSVNAQNIERIQGLIAEGKAKYVLGFNEPDGVQQANMTVDQALDLWPMLEQLNVPLGSPATVNPTNPWMVEFMERADELGLRIDFVAVHHYGGSNPLALISKLKQTYEDYGRPIWITEFAVADWNATSPENNRYTDQEIIDFMEVVLPALDDIDWVHRYAWFDGRQAPLFTSSLFDEDANTTAVGQVYANNNPNLEIGPGVDTEFVVPPDEDNIIINGGFESNQLTPWAGFNRSIVGAATTQAHTGNFCGRINNNDGSFVYITDLTPGENYTLKFFSKWLNPVPNTFSAIIRNNDGNALLFSLPDMPQTDTWEETSYDFTVPDGVTELKFVFYKGQTTPTFPAFFIDDVSLKLNE